MNYLVIAPEDNRIMYAGVAVRYNRFRKPVVMFPDGMEIAFACAVDIVEVETIPADFEPDKYLYVNGEFVLNPDYDDGDGGDGDDDPPQPAPSENDIPIDEIDEAYMEGVNSIDDIG